MKPAEFFLKMLALIVLTGLVLSLLKFSFKHSISNNKTRCTCTHKQ